MFLSELLTRATVRESHACGVGEVTGIAYDSRAVKPGYVFVAVRGFETDGHKYIPQAVAAGAAVIVCEEKPPIDCPYVIVDNTRATLALISAAWFGYPAEKMRIIGVTGTNGKTTITTLLKELIEYAGLGTAGLIGTNVNMIGGTVLETGRTTPESYELQKLFAEMVEAGCGYCVMEVSSHSVVLDRIAGIHFETAAFTNLTQDHLDFHGTMEKYAAAKALLFGRCRHSVINADDHYCKLMSGASACPVLTFSINNPSDLQAKQYTLSADSVAFKAASSEPETEDFSVSLKIPGMFSVYNALAVLLVARTLGISYAKTTEFLSITTGVKGRVEPVPTDGDYTILIDYAHTPDALLNVLTAVRGGAKGRVISLFGCGGDRDRTKRPIMGKIGTENADFAIITSDNPRTEEPIAIIDEILAGVSVPKERYTVIPDRREAIAYAIANHKPGDVIVLAGKGHETYQEINHVKHHMDEREIVAEILSSKGEQSHDA